MKVVVNARFLTQPFTGVQQYAWKRALYLRDHLPDVVFVTPGNIRDAEKARRLEAQPVGYTDGAFWEQTELPLWLMRQGKPLLLNFGNTAPAGYSHQLATIHDMATWVHPEWFSARFSAYYRWLLPRLARGTHALITVSQFSANEIQQHLEVAPERVHVIYNTMDVPADWVREKQQYVLAVGSFSQRKNYRLLVDIWEREGEHLPELKIRGDVEQIFRDYPDLQQRIAAHPGIRIVQPLDEQAMQDLYRHAALLVNPSLYEGFGLPNLEAMANGCPLLVSDQPVFREICGDAATYADPLDTAAWTQALRELLRHPPGEAQLEMARRRAAHFSEEREGEKLLSLVDSFL